MDIQVSSNFERLLFEAPTSDPEAVRPLMADFAADGSFAIPPAALERIRADFTAERVDEAACAAEMGRVYRDSGLVIDPHSAVGVAAARAALTPPPRRRRSSRSAPPIRQSFPTPSSAPPACAPALPAHLADLMDREETIVVLPNDRDAVADYLRQTARAPA